MHKLILASGAGSSLVVTITIIVDTSAQATSCAALLLLHRLAARTSMCGLLLPTLLSATGLRSALFSWIAYRLR